jgi:hypothetical protein
MFVFDEMTPKSEYCIGQIIDAGHDEYLMGIHLNDGTKASPYAFDSVAPNSAIGDPFAWEKVIPSR